jgi:hypothetical protein
MVNITKFLINDWYYLIKLEKNKTLKKESWRKVKIRLKDMIIFTFIY